MPSAWFVRGNGQVFGPLDDQRLVKLAAEGKIDANTEIAQNQNGPWYPAGKVKGLKFAAAQPKPAAATAQKAPPPPKPTPAPVIVFTCESANPMIKNGTATMNPASGPASPTSNSVRRFSNGWTGATAPRGPDVAPGD